MIMTGSFSSPVYRTLQAGLIFNGKNIEAEMCEYLKKNSEPEILKEFN